MPTDGLTQAGRSFQDTWMGHFASWTTTFNTWAYVLAFVAFCVFGWVYLSVRERAFRGGAMAGGAGGMNYVIGPMGAGKSMFGVKKIIDALIAGQYVVTNVELLPGWAEKVCEKEFGRDYRSAERRARTVRWLEGHYVYERSLRRAMRYRVPCAKCGGNVKECGHSGPYQEARAIFVWDETHNDLNNRDYQGHGTDRAERELEKERRRLVIRWATQLRKLGFVGYLLSQHHENTDAQLRRVCNFIIRLQNQRTAEGLWLARLLPRRLTLFLVYWYPAHLADGTSDKNVKPSSRERYWLPWTRNLYDSWATYHGIDDLDDDDSPIQLPHQGFHRDLELNDDTTHSGAGARDSGLPRAHDHSDRPHNDHPHIPAPAPHKVKPAAATNGNGPLSDHRMHPGDANSSTA